MTSSLANCLNKNGIIDCKQCYEFFHEMEVYNQGNASAGNYKQPKMDSPTLEKSLSLSEPYVTS